MSVKIGLVFVYMEDLHIIGSDIFLFSILNYHVLGNSSYNFFVRRKYSVVTRSRCVRTYVQNQRNIVFQ